MKTVITYGTFDLLHNGHLNLLRRARELGDYLIVGVTSDRYDRERGKLNVQNDLMKRMEDVRNTGYADRIIVEEQFGQKIDDIKRYQVDTFAIGSDWLGQFDYLGAYCEVVYLERTQGVSSTKLRHEQNQIVNVGMLSDADSAVAFQEEAKFVSGVEVMELFDSQAADAVYLASSTTTLADSIRGYLGQSKHVLYEESADQKPEEIHALYQLAEEKSLVLMELIRTAYTPAFYHLSTLIKSNKIGGVKDVALSFPEISPHCLLPILKLLGNQPLSIKGFRLPANGQTSQRSMRAILKYPEANATFQTGGIGRVEGRLVITGTKGIATVPAPWWQAESFVLHLFDEDRNEPYFNKMAGDGTRYVLQEFVRRIQGQPESPNSISQEEAIAMYGILGSIANRNEHEGEKRGCRIEKLHRPHSL